MLYTVINTNTVTTLNDLKNTLSETVKAETETYGGFIVPSDLFNAFLVLRSTDTEVYSEFQIHITRGENTKNLVRVYLTPKSGFSDLFESWKQTKNHILIQLQNLCDILHIGTELLANSQIFAYALMGKLTEIDLWDFATRVSFTETMKEMCDMMQHAQENLEIYNACEE